MKNRTSDRKNLVLYLDVLPAKGDNPLGRCINLSPSGIMLVSRESLDLDKQLKIRLVLPAGEAGENEYLPLTLDLKWKEEDVNPEYFCYGAAFVKLTKKASSQIEEISQYPSFSNNKKISEIADVSDYVIDVRDE